MTRLQSSEKEQLSKAVDSITSYCEKGMSPDDAIIKTAKDMKFTKDRLPILVNIYNIGATAQQWNSGDDPRTKAASFPVANIDNIRKKLYPQTTKCAAKNVPALNFSMPSLSGEDMLACYRPPRRPMRKAAAAPINIDKVGAQLLDAIHVSEEQCKREAHEAYARADFSLQKLAGVLGQAGMPGRESIERVTHAVYGDAGDAVLQCVDQSYPVRTKYAAVEKPLPANHSFFLAMDDAIKKIDDAGKAYAKRDLILQKCASAHAKYKDQWKTVLYGNEVERLVLTPAQAKEAELKKKMNKAAASPNSAEVLRNPESTGEEDTLRGIQEVIDSDEHRAKLRNIMTEAIFTDLINTDEALKKRDPEEVLEAYNDLVEAHPYLATHKMALRTMLRQYLDSEVMDLPTLGQIATLNEQYHRRAGDIKKQVIDSMTRFGEQEYRRSMDERQLKRDEERDARARKLDAKKVKAMEDANKIKAREQKDTAAKNKAETASRNQSDRLRHAIAVSQESRARAQFPFEMAHAFNDYNRWLRNNAGATVRIPGTSHNLWTNATPEEAIETWRGIGVPTDNRGQEIPLPTYENITLGG